MFAIIPISSVALSTVQGISDYWVRLPGGFPAIRNMYTAGAGSMTGGQGAFIYRKVADSKVLIHACGTLFDEDAPAGCTNTVDTVDFKVTSSNKFVYTAAAVAGIIMCDVVADTLLTLNRLIGIEYWAKCSIATAAGDFQILLDESAKCVSPLQTLNVPALTAGVWRHCRNTIDDASLLLKVISVGLKYTVDIGACDFWLDDIQGIRSYRMNAEALTVDQFIPEDTYFALSAAVPAYDSDMMMIFVVYEAANEDSRASN